LIILPLYIEKDFKINCRINVKDIISLCTFVIGYTVEAIRLKNIKF